eukprot:4560952-Prymnesium_polylepis.1
MQGTIRDNILFGLAEADDEAAVEVTKARYQRALRLACLEADLRELKDGDATRVGENGLCLSGGQKARVALARAIFAEAQL